ncbi:MAG: hypothetical protein JKY56_21620 [Kofleriaceae bacterium]|nr:hypothetical protein [Kofleriaceae bacterium]
MRLAPHIFLLLVVASCGGSSANHSEVAQLRADVASMELRLQQAEARQPDQPASDNAAPVVTSAAPDMNRELTLVELFARIVERVCSCDDMKCAEGEMKALDQFASEDQPDPEEMKAIIVDVEKMTNCLMKLTKVDAGTP